MTKKYFVIELFVVFILIMERIWLAQKEIISFIAIAMVAISWWKNKDNLKTLGFLPNDFTIVKKMSLVILLSGLVFSLIGFWLSPGTTLNFELVSAIFISAFGYLIWALFQQLILNGYFSNRLQSIFGNVREASFVSGLLFAVAHMPNPVLAPIALIGGAISSYFFLKSKNIFPLVIAHAIIAAMIIHLVPTGWHHNMTVGYNFFK
ncbi:MAG: CPBP family glutamic-type intramembrane protease [Patescibacteria group bacterium]